MGTKETKSLIPNADELKAKLAEFAERQKKEAEEFKQKQLAPLQTEIRKLHDQRAEIDAQIEALQTAEAELLGIDRKASVRKGKGEGKRTRSPNKTEAEKAAEAEQLAKDGKTLFGKLKKAGAAVKSIDLKGETKLGRVTDALEGYEAAGLVKRGGQGIGTTWEFVKDGEPKAAE